MATNGKGRPKIEIDWKQFEYYCELQCTLRECADSLNCSERTLEDRVKEHYNLRFCDVFKLKRQKGLMSLRRNMFELSKKSADMSKFLAKNWLGMKDTTEIIGDESKPLRHTIEVIDSDTKKALAQFLKE